MPVCSESAIAAPIDHRPAPMSDTSTVVASPVRSRWSSAPMIPPAMVIAPIESPNAGAGVCTGFSPTGVAPIATPARHQ